MAGIGLALLRIAVGVVLFVHGLPKVFPIPGGGPMLNAQMFESVGLVPGLPWAVGSGAIETLGGLLIVAGGFTLWVSLLLIIDTAVIAWKFHVALGLFVNWQTAPGAGHGFEFHLLLICALLCLVLAGPGALSLDGRRARHAELEAAGRARLRAGRV
jgi:putative oxidoreductase